MPAAPATPDAPKPVTPPVEEKKRFIVRLGQYPEFKRGSGMNETTVRLIPGQVEELTKAEYLAVSHQVDKYSAEVEASIQEAIKKAEKGVDDTVNLEGWE